MALASLIIYGSCVFFIFWGFYKQLCIPAVLAAWVAMLWSAWMKITGQFEVFDAFLTDILVRLAS